MRRTSITSCLLILVLITSTLGCVAGSPGKASNFCSGVRARKTCQKTKPGIGATRGSACHDAMRSRPDPCSLRGFLHSQVAVLPDFEMPSLSLLAAGQVSLPCRAIFIASSIGSPQTDRGPPRS